MTTPSANAVDIFDSMAETRRRQKATVTGGESTLDDDSGYTREFQSDDQKFMLWTMANRDLRPRTHKPAFRLLGLFPDMDATIAHAEQVFAVDQTCSLHAATTHAWYTIPLGDKSIEDGQAKVNRNLLHHQEMLQSHATEFKDRHDALTAGRTPALEQAQDARDQVAREDRLRQQRKDILQAAVGKDEDTVARLKKEYEERAAEQAQSELEVQASMKSDERGESESKESGDVEEYVEPVLVPPVCPESLNENWSEKVEVLGEGRRPPPVSRILEVRNQRYAVVSVVDDYETRTESNPIGDEPGVIVWAAFDSEEEAIKYNKVVASKELRDHDLAIVCMYEWLYPHMMTSDKVDQLYRNEELNNIMKHARTSSTRVREFESMCERENIECPTTTVEADLSAPAPRQWAPPIGSDLDDTSFVAAPTDGDDLPGVPDQDVENFKCPPAPPISQ